MNSKRNMLPTAEIMKNEDEAFEIIIHQIEGGTISFSLILIYCLNEICTQVESIIKLKLRNF